MKCDMMVMAVYRMVCEMVVCLLMQSYVVHDDDGTEGSCNDHDDDSATRYDAHFDNRCIRVTLRTICQTGLPLSLRTCT